LSVNLLEGGNAQLKNITTYIMARPVAYREREEVKGGGIYCFYPFDNKLDEYCKGVFKIGMAISFQHRTGNYHTYLPQGVYTSALLVNPTKKKNTFATERIYYQRIEKEIYADVEKFGGRPIYMAIRKQNKGKTEWIYTNINSIDKAFENAQKKYGGELKLFKLRLPGKENQVPYFTGKINFY